MDDPREMRAINEGKNIDDKKLTKKERLKKKLLTVQKRLNDLHHRRKLAHRHYAKARKTIHNEINQIVKRLRARERNLLSDIDEAYATFEHAKIYEESLKLQSVYSHCQALLQNLNDLSGKAEILSNVASTLSEVNCSETTDFKPLLFNSDFDLMKSRAENYGQLVGDFIKQDQCNPVMDENVFCVSEDLDVKRECVDQDNINVGASYCFLGKCSSEESDIEETFQVINMIDNMHCTDLEDYALDEEDIVESNQTHKKKLDEEAYERESKVAKTECCKKEKLHKINAKNINFNPDEEWKHVQELNKKLEELQKKTSKISNLKDMCSNIFNKEKKHISLKTDNWSINRNSQKDILGKEKNAKNINATVNMVSPSDLIRKSFLPYQAKGDTEYWLASK